MNTDKALRRGSGQGFYGLGIAPGILEVIDRLGFRVPTPIQEQSLPAGLEGKDLIGIAQTGTGKTLAFAIPMIQGLMQRQGRGLVILPTRELALQVHETFCKIGSSLGLKAVVLIGGESMGRQIGDLRRHPHVVIGTPGRILDHLQQKTLNFSQTKILVLDEADRMLDMGFAPQLSKILQVVPRERQTMLFSATMPSEIVKMAQSYMKLPIRVEVAPSGSVVKEVTQELFFVSKEAKPLLLEKLLQEYKGSVLVFARTKFGVKRIARGLYVEGYAVGELHSNRTLNQRREALQGFKMGKYRVLVATDIAARGIDVKNIELVVNYDLPSNAEDYVHRIGRTARAGMKGHAIAFATPDQRGDVKGIERLIRATLPLSKLPELPGIPPRREVGFRQDSPNSAFQRNSPAQPKSPGGFIRTDRSRLPKRRFGDQRRQGFRPGRQWGAPSSFSR